MDSFFASILNGLWGHRKFNVISTEQEFDLVYFLVDGIYPKWATFVKPLSAPTTTAETKFTKAQEAARKDVERLFGVVKGRFKIMRSGNRVEFHTKQFLMDIVTVRTSSVRMKTFMISTTDHTFDTDRRCVSFSTTCLSSLLPRQSVFQHCQRMENRPHWPN